MTSSKQWYLSLAVAVALLAGINAPMVFASGGSGSGGSGSGSGGSGGGTPAPAPAPVVTTTTAAALVFSGTSGVFPSVTTLGTGPFTETFAVINTGTIPLQINSVAFSSIVPDYTLSGAGAGLCSDGTSLPTGTGTTLSPVGANVCTVTATYQPSALGFSLPPQINFTFGNSAAQTAALVATNVLTPDPSLAFSAPASVVSLDTPVAATSSAGLFQILNNGGSTLITSLSMSGANPQDFVRVPFRQNPRGASAPDCSLFGDPISLLSSISGGGGISCNIQYAFVPTAEGPRSATLTLTTNDPLNPIRTVDLSGNGLPALPPPTPVAAFNFTDEWTSPVDTALVLNVIHHAKASGFTNSDAVVATIDTVDASSALVRYSLKNGAWTSTLSYAGDITDASGAVVGSATLDFTDASNGTLSYTVNGVTTSEAIARAAF